VQLAEPYRTLLGHLRHEIGHWYEPTGFPEIVDTWLPLTYALNAVNRSMGKADLYPFYLAPAVLGKLRFVHDAVTGPGG